MASAVEAHKGHVSRVAGCPICALRKSWGDKPADVIEVLSVEVVKPAKVKRPKAKPAVIEYDDTTKRLHVAVTPEAEVEAAIAAAEAMPPGDYTIIPPADETREAWLLRAVAAIRPWFPAAHRVPDVRVSMGFPAGRGSSKLIGQCWYTTDDKAPALFVSPELSATTDIVTTVLHEMVHAAVGSKAGHRGPFKKVAMGLGFEAPMRSTPASDPLKARIAQVAWELGEFPHSKVNKTVKGTARDVQGTRMLKVACVECGCLIRMTRKWLDEVGAPVCRCGGEMMEGIA